MLTTIQLQLNAPTDWKPITSALNDAFLRSRIFEKNVVLTPPAMPLQIDLPDSVILKLGFAKPYVYEIYDPQENLMNGRL